MRTLVLALLLLAPAVRADVVRSLERGVKYAGTSKTGKDSFQVNTPTGGVMLRAHAGGNGIIVVDGKEPGIFGQRSTSRMFYLDAGGKVAANDRPELVKLLANNHIDRAAVVRGVRSNGVDRHAAEHRLASANGKIDSMLDSVKSLSRPSHLGNGIDFEPGGPTGSMLIVNGGGIFLGGDKTNGFTVTATERAEIAAALLN